MSRNANVTIFETTITLPTYLPAALVGLAGPWISGGIEFNWPQHHRPANFLPVNYKIEKHPNGSVIVWCSDHCKRRLKSAAGVMCVAGEMDLG